MSSACFNPFLYAYLNENFRKEFVDIFARMSGIIKRVAVTLWGLVLHCMCCEQRVKTNTISAELQPPMRGKPFEEITQL
jgi:hypothetical protein